MPILAPPPAEAPAAPSLAAMRWKKRVVVAFADGADDPALARQRQALRELASGPDDRDLHLVLVAGAQVEGAADTAQALRRRFHVERGFRAVLIGKDGGEKLSRSQPLTVRQLAETIDAMPMRRDEMKR